MAFKWQILALTISNIIKSLLVLKCLRVAFILPKLTFESPKNWHLKSPHPKEMFKMQKMVFNLYKMDPWWEMEGWIDSCYEP